MTTKTYTHTAPFILESGKVLPQFRLAYTTLGTLNKEKSNVVIIDTTSVE